MSAIKSIKRLEKERKEKEILLIESFGLVFAEAKRLLDLINLLKQKGKNLEDLIPLVDEINQLNNQVYAQDRMVILSNTAWKDVTKVCSKCGGTLARRKLSGVKSKKNLFGYAFVDYCSTCGFEKFSHLDFLTEQKKIHTKFVARMAELSQANFSSLCPICGKSLVLLPVRTTKGKANLFGWKSNLVCFSCGYEKYSKLSINKRLK